MELYYVRFLETIPNQHHEFSVWRRARDGSEGVQICDCGANLTQALKIAGSLNTTDTNSRSPEVYYDTKRAQVRWLEEALSEVDGNGHVHIGRARSRLLALLESARYTGD